MTSDHSCCEHYRPGAVELACIGLVGFTLVADWFKFWGLIPSPEVWSLIATLIGAWPIFKEAFSNILARRMTMELSMAIAILAALSIGEHTSALVITLAVLVAEILEGMTISHGRRAIKNLLDFLPKRAMVKRNGKTQDIYIEELKVSDIIVVKPGEKIPVDGTVIDGHSYVAQAAITGESMPVEKSKGSLIYAGTINQSGMLEVRTSRLGRDTAFGHIIEAVEKAEKSRAPIQKTADYLAGYLVYFAFACAALTFFLSHNIKDTISVIIVAGACGVAAGTPLAILGGIGQAAHLGVVVKGGLYMEVLGKVDTVVLDKTGTLTFGAPELVDIRPLNGTSTKKLLEAAAIAERFSEHPFASAVLKKAKQESITVVEPKDFEAIHGKGILCTINGEQILVGKRSFLQEKSVDMAGQELEAHSSDVFVSRAGKLLGTMSFQDVLRPEAAEAIKILRQMGIRTILLTGDTKEVAEDIAQQLGVDEVQAQLLPDQKLDRVKELMAQKKIVAMIGDGINDAPALTQASVGVAMGSGTDVARENAQVLLIGNNLLKFTDAIKIARHCHKVILFNFAGTLMVDAMGVGFAAFGFLNPIIAAFIHVGSELVFILNSARLFPAKFRKSA